MLRLIVRVILASIMTFICFFISIGLVYGAGWSPIMLFIGTFGGLILSIFITEIIMPSSEWEDELRARNLERERNRDWAGIAIYAILFILGFWFPFVWLGMLLGWLNTKRK